MILLHQLGHFWQQNQLNITNATLATERANTEEKEKKAKEAQNLRLQFDRRLAKAEDLVDANLCPTPHIKELKKLALNHPDNKIMVRKIEKIENNKPCK